VNIKHNRNRCGAEALKAVKRKLVATTEVECVEGHARTAPFQGGPNGRGGAYSKYGILCGICTELGPVECRCSPSKLGGGEKYWDPGRQSRTGSRCTYENHPGIPARIRDVKWTRCLGWTYPVGSPFGRQGDGQSRWVIQSEQKNK
jgi:hypothetical protein